MAKNRTAKDFIQYMKSAPELQASLSRAGWSVDSVVTAGQQAGFGFTADEYRAAYGELAESELSAATGGLQCGGATPPWKRGGGI